MSNLENLVEKILINCKGDAERIIKAAKAEADAYANKAVKEAEIEKERILADAKTEAQKTAERIILSKKLELRDQALREKRTAIDRVFNMALERLNNMPKSEYRRFLQSSFLPLDIDGGEVILPARYGIGEDELNAFLKRNGKDGTVTLHVGTRVINGGFVLIKAGVEYNCTFEALLEYSRYELESEIARSLF